MPEPTTTHKRKVCIALFEPLLLNCVSYLSDLYWMHFSYMCIEWGLTIALLFRTHGAASLHWNADSQIFYSSKYVVL